ncbi:MAG: hypothetical protein SPJ13_05080 [Bacteroidales bacterium]|nr:hypothetical protein [Bacteroidales bacterium]
MKRFILFLALLATGGLLQGQTLDSNYREDEVVSSRGNLTFGNNVAKQQDFYIHDATFDNSLRTSEWFVETKVMLASIAGVEWQVAYVPRHFGLFGSLAIGGESSFHRNMLSAGVVLRPIAEPRWIDLQLYGGIAGGYGIGTELGIRLATVSGTRFSWVSGSYGWIITNKAAILTLGLSIDMAALFGLALWTL